jgi:hypothetical protein
VACNRILEYPALPADACVIKSNYGQIRGMQGCKTATSEEAEYFLSLHLLSQENQYEGCSFRYRSLAERSGPGLRHVKRIPPKRAHE